MYGKRLYGPLFIEVGRFHFLFHTMDLFRRRDEDLGVHDGNNSFMRESIIKLVSKQEWVY